MSDSMARLVIIGKLIKFEMPVDDALKAVSRFGWDFEGDGYELTISHLKFAIRKFIDGSISSVEVEDWANAVEGREDIKFEEVNAKLIDEVIYDLANPALQGELTIPGMFLLLERMGGGGEVVE